eukprot:g1778.t1
MILSKPYVRICRALVVPRKTPRLPRKRLNAPRIRIFATYESEFPEDFDDFDQIEYADDDETEDDPFTASSEVGERSRGIVKWFDDKKGFGFITQDDGSGDIFVHQTNIQSSGFRSLREGEAVEYEAIVSNDGRLSAVQVTGPEGREPLGAQRDSPFSGYSDMDRGNSEYSGKSYNENRYSSEPNTEMGSFSSGLQVVVHNIPWSVTDDGLKDFFMDYNTVSCEIQYDEMGRSRGYGVVKFSDNEDAKRAIMDLHGTQLDGRTVSVRFDRYG